MGQYFLGVNLTAREYIEPQMCKFMEHSWLLNSAPTYICMDLYIASKPKLIIWAGDYEDEVEGFDPEKDTLYTMAKKDFLCINNDKQEKAIRDILDKETYDQAFQFIKEWYMDKYLYCPDAKEYLAFKDCPDNDNWIIHPLCALVANSDGAGGSFRANHTNDPNNYYGSWRGLTVGIANEKEIIQYAKDFKLITPNFIEL